MANLTDKINAARKEGYSDDEIITHLSSSDLRDKIEAARQEGYNATEIADFLGGASGKPRKSSGYASQFWAGIDAPLENLGTTAEATGFTDTGKFLKGLTEAPKDHVSASENFINKGGEGFNWSELPGAAIEQGGQVLGSIGARLGMGAALAPLGPGAAAVGAIGGPFIFEFAQQIGPLALERAKNNGRTEPTFEDWSAAAAGSTFSGALNAIGIGGVGKLNSALGIGKNIAKEGVTEAGQSVIEQGTATIGTEAGGKIDLKQAVGEGIIGGTSVGGVDAARNAKPMVDRGMDELSVRRQIKNDPYAREKAEITDDVNRLAERETQQGRDLQSAEITSYVNDLKNQATELIRKQRLKPDDQDALLKGLNTAKGLTDERLNEIAGRSESPAEIKALANRIQLIRSLTVQQQAYKGTRGTLATAARWGGGAAGAAIGQALGTGPVEGAYIGQSVGRTIAQKIANSQSQGARIDSLVGKKQARRARLLLDRYGPSDATKALNTLTERAAAKEAEAAEQARVVSENQRIANDMKMYQKQRAELQKAVEQAKNRDEKAKAQAEKKKNDDANRELRLQAMALDKVYKESRNKAILEKLETAKSLNALTVEATQVKTALATAMAAAKAEGADRQRNFEIANMKGHLEKLALDIEKRQTALKKAQIATRQAEKTSAMAPKQTAPALARIRAMGAKWAKSVDASDGIENKPAYMSATEYLDGLRQQAQVTINAEPDAEVRNLLRETLTDLISLKNNWDARRERFNRALGQAKQMGGDAQQKLRDTLYQLAHYKAPSQQEGREDYGTDDNETEIPF